MATSAAELARDIRALTERVGVLIETMEAGGIGNAKVNQTFGGNIGPWQVASVCACFFTMFALIIALVVIVPDVHDLRAWRDIHSAKIARLEAAQEHK